jgi:hypothetical protein
MEKAFAKAEEIAGTLKEYINNRIESAKLVVVEKTSAMIAALMARMILMMLAFFFLLFTGVALSIFLGDRMGNGWLGFLVVAAAYLLAGMIVWLGRERLIRRPVMNKMIRQLFNKDDQ